MDKNRKQRLKALIDSRFEGNQQRFANCIVMSKGRVSQLLDENEPFGERAAKNILVKLNNAGVNLPDSYFDVQTSSTELAAPAPTPKITVQQALAVLQAEIEQQASAATSIHHLEHAWPFKNITRDQWLDLTDEQRAVIESVAASMVSTHHSASGGGGQHDKRQAA